MAAAGSRNDPLASFNFIVTVENMRAGFSEVGGLAWAGRGACCATASPQSLHACPQDW